MEPFFKNQVYELQQNRISTIKIRILLQRIQLVSLHATATPHLKHINPVIGENAPATNFNCQTVRTKEVNNLR